MNTHNKSGFSHSGFVIYAIMFSMFSFLSCNDNSFKGGTQTPAAPSPQADDQTPAPNQAACPNGIEPVPEEWLTADFPSSAVKDCIEGGHFFYGYEGANECTSIPLTTCTAEEVKKMQTDFNVSIDDPIAQDMPKNAKIFGCSHFQGAKYELLLFQYFFLELGENTETCKQTLKYTIHTDCRALQSSGAAEDLKWYECLKNGGN